MTRLAADVGSPGTVASASGQRIYSFNNITTAPQQIIGTNAQRQSVTFHNPGGNDILVAPSFVQNGGTDTALVPSLAALGGCFRVYGNGGTLTLSGEVQKPWQAFAVAGATNALTVMDSNI